MRRPRSERIPEGQPGIWHIVSKQGGVSLFTFGHTDEPARVTVNGQTVPTDSGNRFRAVVPLNQDVPIVAIDGRGNTRLRTIRIASTGPGSRTFTYDAVGNLTADGLRAYTWDAENRLVSITQGTKRSEFTYDGMSRRVRIIEKNNNVVQSNKTYLWVGAEMAEERDATGATVTKRYFSQGISIGGVKHYYCKDHLGSVREVRDSTGALEARYDYSTFGVRTRTSGTFDAEIGYTGHWHHQSGVVMAWFRGYDPSTGRWLSRDPIGERGGMNLYGYVGNRSIIATDLVGLEDSIPPVISIPVLNKEELAKQALALIENDQRARGYFRPGPYAGVGYLIKMQRPYASSSILEMIQDEGNSRGCNSCGSSTSGTPNGRWITDHQPSKALSTTASNEFRGYPHWQTCSATQGGFLKNALGLAGSVLRELDRGLGAMGFGVIMDFSIYNYSPPNPSDSVGGA